MKREAVQRGMGAEAETKEGERVKREMVDVWGDAEKVKGGNEK